MTHELRHWAFVAPVFSSHMNAFYGGILDFLKVHPNVFIDRFAYDRCDLDILHNFDGFITFALPPKEIHEAMIRGRDNPCIVSITMCTKAPEDIAVAQIDSYGIAEQVVKKLRQRHCQSFGFCSCYLPQVTDESAQLLLGYRKAVWETTGKMPKLYRPKTTSDANLIMTEFNRFVEWLTQMPKPCGLFVHTDEVAKKVLDACRLYGIDVPRDVRVISTGNSEFYCERTIPTLSSYAVDHQHVGFNAARALMDITERRVSPHDVAFSVPLQAIVERGSSLDKFGSGRLAEEARRFIREELSKGNAPSLQDIASHFNVSRSKIHKDFLAVTGHTLHDEVNDRRLETLEKSLLASSETIGILARRAGFSSISQADRSFKARHGISMGEFRARGDQCCL